MAVDVNTYFDKLKSPQKEIAAALRKIVLKTFPDIKESMKYGVPYYNDLFYIVALKDSVNLGFAIKNLSKDEVALLDGTGATVRYMKFKTKKDIDEKEIVKMLTLVWSKR